VGYTVSPVRSVDLEIDVTDAAGLGEPARIAVTVTAGDTTPLDPVVCFAKPGAGYGRGYYTEDLPGPGPGAQAAWHATRGWIFVSVDHLGVGDSSLHDPERLAFTPVIAASHAAEGEVRQKLAAGTLIDGLGPVTDPLTVGIGQSMGGAFTIVQQGRHHGYDGVAVLGYSPLRTQPPVAPGRPLLPLPWVPSDTELSDAVWTNAPALAEAAAFEVPHDDTAPMAWGFHYDDVDPAVVRRDMEDYPARHGDLPPWGSATIPATAVLWCLAPGSTLAEAAAIRCPVLVALGERDALVDPRGEPRAYESASSVDLFVCPRMAHMHNFAGTRELFWRRLETWAEWVRAVRESRPKTVG
jgi:alpha-beta hydrolase superfamily lysophospholipase